MSSKRKSGKQGKTKTLAEAIAELAAGAGSASVPASAPISAAIAAGAGAAPLPDLKTIGDIESLVIAIVSRSSHTLSTTLTQYAAVEPTTDDMLAWEGYNSGYKRFKYSEIQDIPFGLARVGTVGDGNCMLHAILFSLSPTYRAHNMKARSYIAVKFREVLKARMEELRDIADIIYAVIGGAEALEHIFYTLKNSKDSQLDLQMGLLIGRLYNINFLAVQLQKDMTLKPVCETHLGYDAGLPTILINYQGGTTNAGGNGAPKASGFMGGGHYEGIFIPMVSVARASSASSTNSASKRSQRKTKKRSSEPTENVIALDEVRTQYIIPADRLAVVLALFSPCGRL